MGRKKLNDKKSNFGITLHPEIIKMLEEQSEKEGVSKSKLIEDALKDHLKDKKQ